MVVALLFYLFFFFYVLYFLSTFNLFTLKKCWKTKFMYHWFIPLIENLFLCQWLTLLWQLYSDFCQLPELLDNTRVVADWKTAEHIVLCQLLPVRLLKMLQYIVNFPLADQIQLSLWLWPVVYSLVLSLIFVNQQYHLIHLCESKEKVLLWLNGNSLLQVKQHFFLILLSLGDVVCI